MFNNFYIVFAMIVFYLSHSVTSQNNELSRKLNWKLNFTEIAGKYGYSTEEHTVITEDGYILTMFRMKGKQCQGKSTPLVLMHGLLMGADTFLDAGPGTGLAYLLADACYDLWVGNCRGNYYGRAHVSLNPNKDAKFWAFTTDEIGYYDVPATVDYVLDYTGYKKLNYIGFSQGAGTVFIMCSERPGYSDKLNLFVGLAPAARQTNTQSLLFRAVCTTCWKLYGTLSTVGVHEVFAKELQVIGSVFCKLNNGTTDLCRFLLWLIDSPHPNSITQSTIRTLYDHFPAGTSLQNMARYGQSMATTNFQKYDNGLGKPGKFNLSASTMPVMIIYGENDGMVDTKDVKWLASKLPNVLESYLVADPLWTHMDNMYSRFIPKSIFPKLQEYLSKYTNFTN